MVDQLIHVIGREAALFEEFLGLLQEQREALVNNDVDTVKRLTELQREKLVENQLLNKEREDLIERIRTANQIDGDLTVSRLLDFVDDQQADRLIQLKQLILDLNEQITETRNSNVMLLNQSRESIAQTMAMLSKINHPKSTYGRNGDDSQTQAAVAVDRRA